MRARRYALPSLSRARASTALPSVHTLHTTLPRAMNGNHLASLNSATSTDLIRGENRRILVSERSLSRHPFKENFAVRSNPSLQRTRFARR